MDTGNSKPDIIGVVLVHGIGTSRRGDTLTNWAMPILEQLKVKPKDALVRLQEDPASLEFDAGPEKDAATIRVEESWWEDLFSPPSFLEFVKWGLRSAPMTIVSHFDEKFRRVTNHHECPKENEQAYARMALALELFVLLFGLLLVLPVTMLLIVLTLLYSVPQLRDFVLSVQAVLTSTVGDSMVFVQDGLLRETIIEKVRSDIRRARKNCTSRCVVLAHSQGAAVAHQAIQRIIESDEETDKSPITFISFGSGVRKLTELRRTYKNLKALGLSFAVTGSAFVAGLLVGWTAWQLRLEQPFLPTMWLVVFSMLACSVGLWLRMFGFRRWVGDEEDKDTEKASSIANWLGLLVILLVAVTWSAFLPELRTTGPVVWVAVPVLLGLAFTLLMEWRYEVKRKTHRSHQKGLEERRWSEWYNIGRGDWFDFYSTFDPVPNGPLMDLHVVETYHPEQITLALSVIKDHDSRLYFQAGGRFLQRVASVIREDWKPQAEEAPPRLLLTAPKEIWFRGLSLIVIGAWLWVALDSMVLRRVRESALVDNWLSDCNPISFQGQDSGFCMEVGGFEAMFNAVIRFGIAILLFAVSVYLSLWLLRVLFIPVLREAEVDTKIYDQQPGKGIKALCIVFGFLALAGFGDSTVMLAGEFELVPVWLGYFTLVFGITAGAAAVGIWYIKRWGLLVLRFWFVACLMLLFASAYAFNSAIPGGITAVAILTAVFVVVFMLLDRFVASKFESATQ